MILNYSISAFVLTFVLIGLFLPLLKNHLLDTPNYRSLHKIPIPKGGGIFFSAISSILMFLSGNSIGLLCLPISIIGLLDDKFNISRKVRYVSQLLSVLLIFHLSNGYFQLLRFESFPLKTLLIITILLFGTAFINFTNFMDGLDGLIAGCMIIWFSTIAINGNITFSILVGSLIGFIIWNWSPAKIFMGDAGSTFLGLMVVGTIFNMKSIVYAINSLLILSPLFLDSITCILMRLINKQNIFTPHRKHLYQRLHRAGLSKRLVASIYIANTILLAIAFLKSNVLLYATTFLTIIFGIVLNETKAYNFEKQ